MYFRKADLYKTKSCNDLVLHHSCLRVCLLKYLVSSFCKGCSGWGLIQVRPVRMRECAVVLVSSKIKKRRVKVSKG